jgi:hypothetical protein
MTFRYMIIRTEYVSGEAIHLFAADCLPARWAIGYVIETTPAREDYDGEVRVVFLRTA